MLKVVNLSKNYKSKEGLVTEALKKINIVFPSKGMVFITGKSGSGKTTLLNILGGMDTADSGELVINGKSDKNFKTKDYDGYRNNYIGFVFQDFLILDDYTIGENVGLAYGLQGKEAPKEEIESILKKVDLSGFFDRRTNELSGGQKQRVAIARALIKKPEIILADEPTGNLDSATGEGIFQLLKKLSEDRLVIVVSHDREAGVKYGDRIITLSDGVIESDERVDEEIPFDRLTVKDEKIYLPKRKLTGEELESLNKAVTEGKKISLRNTEIIEDEEKEYVTVKNRLPLKTALRLGTAGIKLKPGKIIIVTILMIWAFALLGTVSSAFFYKHSSAVLNIIKQEEKNYVFLQKGDDYSEFEGIYDISEESFQINDYEKLSEEFSDLLVTPIYDINTAYLQSGSNNSGRSFNNLKGLLVLPKEKLNSLNYSVKFGEYPDTGSGDIAITDYVADILISGGYYSSYEDIIARGYYDWKGYMIPVSGIIDTDYEDFNDVDKNNYKNERTRIWNYNVRNLYSLVFTSDNSSAENVFNKRNEQYLYFEGENYNSFENTMICSENLLTQDLLLEDIELTYFDPEADISDITLSGNNVIVNSIYFYNKFGQNDTSLPKQIEYQGKNLNIVGFIKYTFPEYGNRIYTSDEIYGEFESNLELKGIFAELSGNNIKDIALIESARELEIIDNIFYSELLFQIDLVILVLKYILLGIGIFFVLYATVMLFNFISLTVNSKSKDIGILRAIGARKSDVIAIYLAEALIIAIFSAIFSLPYVKGGCLLMNFSLFRMNEGYIPEKILSFINLNFITVIIIFTLSITVAALGALVPVLRLSRMCPVDAIKKI